MCASLNIPESHMKAIQRLASLSDRDAASMHDALAAISPSLKHQDIAEQVRASVDLPGISEIVSALMAMNSARVNSGRGVCQQRHRLSIP